MDKNASVVAAQMPESLRPEVDLKNDEPTSELSGDSDRPARYHTVSWLGGTGCDEQR